MAAEVEHVSADVVVAGANFTGMAAALALSVTLGAEYRIAVVDRREPAATADDPRCFALSAASRRLLTALGVWSRLADAAQDVTEIVITDSPLEAAVRPVVLHYDNILGTGEAAASIVPAGALLSALHAACVASPSIVMAGGFEIASWRADAGMAEIAAADGRTVGAQLALAADGRKSRLASLAGIKTVVSEHGQTGIVTVVRHSRPHNGTAVQHFLPDGPFAMLPLPGSRSCITWSETTANADRCMALDDAGFLGEISRRAGGRLGELSLDGRRAAWPLSTKIARSFVAPRLALIGDAAHGVHPIAGQGLNLAFRDVATLAEEVGGAARIGLDIGADAMLDAYARRRRFDATSSAGVFDAINRLFSNDNTILRSIRDAGMGVVDRIPGLKRRLVEEAAGLTGEVPPLMQDPVGSVHRPAVGERS